jgi:hypothetical protein
MGFGFWAWDSWEIFQKEHMGGGGKKVNPTKTMRFSLVFNFFFFFYIPRVFS